MQGQCCLNLQSLPVDRRGGLGRQANLATFASLLNGEDSLDFSNIRCDYADLICIE